MRKYLLVFVLVMQLSVATFAAGQKVYSIPKEYSLTFDQAMNLVTSDNLLIKCLGVDSYYNDEGTGYGVSGQGKLDRWLGSRTFQVFVPVGMPTISRPSRYSLKWYSSLSGSSGQKSRFKVASTLGLDHIHVSSFRDGELDKTGNFYLKVIPEVAEINETEVIKPVGEAKRIIKTFAQGDSAEAIFELSDSVSVAQKNGIKISAELASVENSSEVAHAAATTRAVKIGVKDDGKSLMFPAEQKVLVLTITEKFIVNKKGEVVKKVSIDSSSEKLLTIKKVRPDKKGDYRWRKK